MADGERGADLAAAYSRVLVEPLLERVAPGMPFSTARLGSGSDVLGLDDAMSRDHDWGLRLTVVVAEEHVGRVDAILERDLPEHFRGRPVRFGTTWDPVVRQRAEVVSAPALAADRAGLPAEGPLEVLDWASVTGQAALELTAGPVLRDDDGVLGRLRDRFERYPDDVRRWAVASAWAKLGQELPFVGRAGARGDDLGSRLIAGRLALTAMRLGFLLERRWAPYSKWLGTAFAALPLAASVGPLLRAAVEAEQWEVRQDALAGAIDALSEAQAAAGLPSLTPATEPFWDRPHRGVRGVPELVRATIDDPLLRRAPLVGTPEQWTDDVGLLVDHRRRRAATAALLAP